MPPFRRFTLAAADTPPTLSLMPLTPMMFMHTPARIEMVFFRHAAADARYSRLFARSGFVSSIRCHYASALRDSASEIFSPLSAPPPLSAAFTPLLKPQRTRCRALRQCFRAFAPCRA
jgi:hypothetical protein